MPEYFREVRENKNERDCVREQLSQRESAQVHFVRLPKVRANIFDSSHSKTLCSENVTLINFGADYRSHGCAEKYLLYNLTWKDRDHERTEFTLVDMSTKKK